MDDPELDPQWPDAYPRLLVDLGSKIVRWLEAEGLSADRSWSIAMRLTDEIMRDWAGQQLYIPGGRRREAAERAAQIRSRFRGDNSAELAREFGCTERRIRQVVEEADF